MFFGAPGENSDFASFSFQTPMKASWAKPTGTPTRHRATVITIVLIFIVSLDWETDCAPDYADHSSAAWRTRQLAIRRPQSYPSRLNASGFSLDEISLDEISNSTHND